MRAPASPATFSLPPELERSAPRDVATDCRRPGADRRRLAAGGAAHSRPASRCISRRSGKSDAAADIDRRGVTATAVVDRLWRKNGDGKPAFAAFHFDANGARIDGESRHAAVGVARAAPGFDSAGALSARRTRIDSSSTASGGAGCRSSLAYVVSSLLARDRAAVCRRGSLAANAARREGRPARAVVTEVHKHHAKPWRLAPLHEVRVSDARRTEDERQSRDRQAR